MTVKLSLSFSHPHTRLPVLQWHVHSPFLGPAVFVLKPVTTQAGNHYVLLASLAVNECHVAH